MTVITETPKLVTVFGASGFVGRHVVRALAKRGYYIRAAGRERELATYLQPIGNMGQVVHVQANLRVPASLTRAMAGVDHVVNLAGILAEGGRQTFEAVHAEGAGAVAKAAREAGIGVTHLSALGADPQSRSVYARSKALGEQAVFAAAPDATVLRPSVVFGPEDSFFNRFAEMARFSPALPLIGGGRTRFQPVYVGDVAEAVARAVDGTLDRGRIYELGGPEVLTFRQCLERMLDVVGRRRLLLPIPWGIAEILGSIGNRVPFAPITRDQVELLKTDNVVSEAARAEGRTLAGLGVEPQSVAALLPTYLWHFRVGGQFANRKEV
ncbi:MAG TPA: complex I NDUFA9 subunit family protein [Mesorhizobium sp.]|jgi:NADH dehydrogenase|nr:complex I NDUFA9 subunit family protein [Mesorhizobium sp.]